MKIKKIAIGAALIATVTITCGFEDWHINGRIEEDSYIVKQGDTLDGIARDFMDKNTYGPRRLNEFKSGIVQLNPWLNTKERQYGGLIYPGDEIRINYWIKKDK